VGTATEFFGVEMGVHQEIDIEQGDIDAYLSHPENKIGQPCCTAAAAFNAARCNCDANTLEARGGGEAEPSSRGIPILPSPPPHPQRPPPSPSPHSKALDPLLPPPPPPPAARDRVHGRQHARVRAARERRGRAVRLPPDHRRHVLPHLTLPLGLSRRQLTSGVHTG
jgi:hypothetical protein